MLKIKKISEVIGRKVFSDNGDFIGTVEELNISDNKVESWRVLVSRASELSSLLGGARGIIVPQSFIKSVGDVVLISKDIVPIRESSSMDQDISNEEVEL